VDKTIIALPIAIVFLFILRGVSAFASEYRHGMGGSPGYAVPICLLTFVTLPVEFYDRFTSGTLITKLVYHVEQVAEATTSVVTSIKEGLTVVGLICLMFYLDPKVTMFTLVVGPLVPCWCATLVGVVKSVRAHSS
jgi:subfamily B ATP-binding cassette protein MsbA